VADPNGARFVDFLERVAADLPFVEPVKSDVMAELTDHLEDSIGERIVGGTTLPQAVEQILRRMGPPEELARSITRSHQTPKRLLAAAGAGMYFGAGIAVSAGVRAGVFAMLPVFVAFVVGRALLAEGASDATNTIALGALGALWVTVCYAIGRGVPSVVARVSHRSMGAAAFGVSIVGGVLGAWFLWTFYRVDLKAYAIVPLLAAPLALVAGAVTSRNGRWLPRVRSLWFAGLISYVAVVALIVLSRQPSVDEARNADPVPSLAIVGDTTRLANDRMFMDVDDRGGFHSIAVEGRRAEYASLHAEVWAATPDLAGLNLERQGPLAAAPLEYGQFDPGGLFWLDLLGVEVVGPGEARVGYHGLVADSIYRDWGPTFFVLVGVGADGSRQLLDYRPPLRPMEFTGSVVEWLLAR
jgi:hypothetical protein